MRSFKAILASLAALSVLAVAIAPAEAHPGHRKPYKVCKIEHRGFLGHKKVRVCHWAR